MQDLGLCQEEEHRIYPRMAAVSVGLVRRRYQLGESVDDRCRHSMVARLADQIEKTAVGHVRVK